VRLLPRPDGAVRVRLDVDEAHLLDQLTTQLIELLESHSRTALDPDPLFASLEVGGSDATPEDPALARLFPDAFEERSDASQFRRVTEQGLLNRKLQDAMVVTSELGLGQDPVEADAEDLVEVEITPDTLPAWVRTLTALRLAIAARIGLDSEPARERLADDEQTRGTVLVYDWLAAILESILRMQTDPNAPADEDALGDHDGDLDDETQAAGDEGPGDSDRDNGSDGEGTDDAPHTEDTSSDEE